MALLKDFEDFVSRGNVMDLAVAVVIGAAFQKIVTALVADLIMPLVSALMPQGDWRAWKVTPLHLAVGDVLGAVVDFLIVAMVLFVVVVQVAKRFKKGAPAGAPVTKQCPECVETIPLAARRCRACTAVQPA